MPRYSVLAHHNLRKGVSELFGPTGWGIYLIVPVPFIVIGVIAWLLYRALRARGSKGL